MNVVFDTNVYGTIASLENCADKSVIDDYKKLRHSITVKKIVPYMSEASLGLEALEREQRINEFFRKWTTRPRGIVLPSPNAKRIENVNKALALGFKVLRTPRISLGELIGIGDEKWAKDELYTINQRQERTFSFIRIHESNGLPTLKKMGEELALKYNLPIMNNRAWIKGIILEYDNSRSVSVESSKKFVKRVRKILAEMCDVDMLASVFGYGFELFCTNDKAKDAGEKGILHPNNIAVLKANYGIDVVTPCELLEKIG